MSSFNRWTAVLVLMILALAAAGCVVHPVGYGRHGGGHRYHEPAPAGWHGHPGRR